MRKQCLCAHEIWSLFRLWGFLTLWLNIAYQWNYGTNTAISGLFNEIYRTCITFTEGEINEIM